MSEKDTTLTDDDITKLKDKIYTFTNNYDDMDFNEDIILKIMFREQLLT